jgi:hypothetical protein
VQGYSKSEVVTCAIALELEMDGAALKLEMNVTALELETNMTPLEMETIVKTCGSHESSGTDKVVKTCCACFGRRAHAPHFNFFGHPARFGFRFF